MEIVIREARPDDAEGIVAVLNPIIASGVYSALDTPLTVEAERRVLRDFPARGLFHVAEDAGDGRIVGIQNLEPYATYTHAFDHVGVISTFVDLARRRRAIGARLAEATFAGARAKGYEKLFTFVRADNPDALEFYLRLGFRIVGTAERQAKIGEKYVDEVIIESFL